MIIWILIGILIFLVPNLVLVYLHRREEKRELKRIAEQHLRTILCGTCKQIGHCTYKWVRPLDQDCHSFLKKEVKDEAKRD